LHVAERREEYFIFGKADNFGGKRLTLPFDEANFSHFHLGDDRSDEHPDGFGDPPVNSGELHFLEMAHQFV
jgi:hypothetical protein